MNDEAANTLLKTLEEPPAYVVLILLTDRPGQVLPTIASRCQPVRFDPRAAEAVAERLDRRRRRADARSPARGSRSATPSGRLRSAAGAAGAARRPPRRFARAPRERRGGRCLAAGRRPRAPRARTTLEAARDEELAVPAARRSTGASTTEYDERISRAERRARTGALDHALQLAGLWFRDLACVAAGAPELAHHADRGCSTPAARPPLRCARRSTWSRTRARGCSSTSARISRWRRWRSGSSGCRDRRPTRGASLAGGRGSRTRSPSRSRSRSASTAARWR